MAVERMNRRRRGAPYPHTYVGRVGVGTTNMASLRPLLRRVGLASRIKLRKRVFKGVFRDLQGENRLFLTIFTLFYPILAYFPLVNP